MRPGVTAVHGLRECAVCSREFMALSMNARYCSPRCKGLVRLGVDRRKYANPQHRGARRRWEPIVATGTVRCRRGSGCRFAEWVDGELVGGVIEPGTPWHLGHPDGEGQPVVSPEHRICNVGSTSRLAAKARRGL